MKNLFVFNSWIREDQAVGFKYNIKAKQWTYIGGWKSYPTNAACPIFNGKIDVSGGLFEKNS